MGKIILHILGYQSNMSFHFLLVLDFIKPATNKEKKNQFSISISSKEDTKEKIKKGSCIIIYTQSNAILNGSQTFKII